MARKLNRDATPAEKIARAEAHKGKKTSKRRKARKATSKRCDIAWSAAVRASGPCRLIGRPGHACGGPIQAAHGFSRRYRGTRWDLRNGFPLCAGGHVKYTYDPLAWDQLLREWWGVELYEEMRAKAQAPSRPDFAAILGSLEGRAA